MTKNTKTKIVAGAVITTLGMGIGYALYTFKKTKKAKMDNLERENQIPYELNQLADEYMESHHNDYSNRKYIELDRGEKEGKQK